MIFCFTSVARADKTNVVKIGSDVTIKEGEKVHNVLVIGGQITVEGVVENKVTAIGGSVVLGKTAVVGGNVFSLGGVVAKGRGAVVHGKISNINLDDISEAISTALSDEWEGWSWIFALISLSFFVGILLITMLIVFFFPKPVRIVSTAIREMPLKTTIWGILVLVMVVPLALLLAVSVVGMVLIPLEITIVLCGAILGFVAVSQLIGNRFFRLLKKQNQSVMVEAIWGLIIIWLIGWIPYFGSIFKACALVVGMGGVLISRFGTGYSR